MSLMPLALYLALPGLLLASLVGVLAVLVAPGQVPARGAVTVATGLTWATGVFLFALAPRWFSQGAPADAGWPVTPLTTAVLAIGLALTVLPWTAALMAARRGGAATGTDAPAGTG